MRWGLVAAWSRDAKSGAPMINARAETLATRPSFRTAFKTAAACSPPTGSTSGRRLAAKTRVPYYISLANDRPFAFAGRWEMRRGEDGAPLESCTIITCEPNA